VRLKLSFIYASISFISIYVVLSVSLRILKLTENYYSHVIAGMIALTVAIFIFIGYLIKNKKVPK
jgi:ABC-type uncharacterized transport system fused permease/ATPase subunit